MEKETVENIIVKKFRKSELVDFRKCLGSRPAYLAYAFLRKIPYRCLEKKTFFDRDPNWQPPGKLMAMLYAYSISQLILRHFGLSDPNNSLKAAICEWIML